MHLYAYFENEDGALALHKKYDEYEEKQMEAAPKLTASGLTGDYRLLADFNDVVLAGHPTQYGVQFITWECGQLRRRKTEFRHPLRPHSPQRPFSFALFQETRINKEGLKDYGSKFYGRYPAGLAEMCKIRAGQVTILFPIPVEQYDQTIEMLQTIDLGFSINRDCKVDEVNSRYSVLEAVQDTLVNVDQLDYLAKRLDGFCAGEVSEFEAMAHKLELTDIKDFINLTFCCQQATVITDFSDLEKIGRDHMMTLSGGAMPMDQYQAVDGRKAALQLLQGGNGTVTPFGVAYDNGMELKPVYNGHQFPVYPYDGLFMVLEITPKRGLAEGKNLEGFYDYRRYGEQRMQQEGGQFNECGYVSYHGTMPLEELMMEDPAEQYQREQRMQMGLDVMVLRMQKGILAPEEANITFPTTLTSVQTEMKGLEEFGNSYGPINGVDGEGTARVLNGRVSVDDLNTEGDVPDAHSFRSELSTGMALCLQRIKAEGGMSKYCAALEVEEPSTFTEALDLAMGNDGGGWCSPDRIRFGAPSEQAVP